MHDPGGEREIVARLRVGDQQAFRDLVVRHHAAMVRFAATFVPSHAVAEEVVQETWLAVIKGVDRFEGHSSLSTWIFRIVANIAKTRGERERRTVPAGDLAQELSDDSRPVPSSRFAGPPGRGRWAEPPAQWSELPDELVIGRGTIERIQVIAAGLSENQRRVFVLRDVEDRSSAEVCDLLELSEGNQRVLLHRARSRVRAALEAELEDLA